MQNTLQRHLYWLAVDTVCTLALCLPSNQWFWNLYFPNNNIIAKYVVLSNIISVVSNSFRICIQEPLWISKTFTVLLQTLSAYNSLLVRYKVYSSDPRQCLCTSWRYAEAYENFSIDPAPFRCAGWILKFCKNVLKENKLWMLKENI